MATTMTGRTMSAVLADYVTGSQFQEKISTTSVRTQSKRVLLDTVAVIGAAGRLMNLRPVTERWLAGEGNASRIADGMAVPALAAAVANGAAANATLLSEGHRGAGGHPAAHVVPAVLAASEDAEVRGADLLDGLVVGYEVAVQVAKSIGTMRSGISPNGNWGSIGAAAGVAYVLSEHDIGAVEAAIEAAAEVALYGPMRTAHDGSDSYRWFVGLGAGAALLCGAGASLGWTSGSGSLSEWYLELAGDPDRDRSSGFEDALSLGGEPEILHNYFKRFGGCAHTLSSIDAVLELRDRGGPSAWKELSSVDIRCASPAAAELNECCPANLFGTRYSIPALCAIALSRGPEAVMELTEESLADPAIQELARRITLYEDSSLASQYPGTRAVEVKATFDSGRSIEVGVRVPLGDYERPLPERDLEAKARALLSCRFDEKELDSVLHVVSTLDEVATADLSKALRLRTFRKKTEEAQ